MQKNWIGCRMILKIIFQQVKLPIKLLLLGQKVLQEKMSFHVPVQCTRSEYVFGFHEPVTVSLIEQSVKMRVLSLNS